MSIVPKSAGEVLVTVNGNQISGLLHASVSTKNCFSADTFAATFALGAHPLSNMGYWYSISSAYVEIVAAGEIGPVPEYLITGLIDTVVIDPIHQTVAIEGRDLSSTMIDSFRQQDFVNQTASEVVARIAQGHNLNPVVTATSGAVGRYYGDGYTRLSLGQFSRLRSDWDVVVQLARENSFDVFVQGQTLFFQPAIPMVQALHEIAISDVWQVHVERSLSLSSQPNARVQSWSSQNMASVDSEGAEPGASSIGGSTSSFLFSMANLTASQAAGCAARYSAELSRLSTSLHLEMPWDLSLTPRQSILISGAGFQWEDIFKVERIERRYSSTSGSRQHVYAVKSE